MPQMIPVPHVRSRNLFCLFCVINAISITLDIAELRHNMPGKEVTFEKKNIFNFALCSYISSHLTSKLAS
jgi:hypothetical protein